MKILFLRQSWRTYKLKRILGRRLLREFKTNFLRYIALFLLISMGMYVIVGMVEAAEIVIIGSEKQAEENKLEDGCFEVLFALSEKDLEAIEKTGVTVEEKGSLDVEVSDKTTLRLMQNREKMNLIALDSGRLAQDFGEIVLEKRYAYEHGITEGGKIELAEEEFIVTGIGSVPDYDLPLPETTDSSVESEQFGLGFLTKEQYEKIREKENIAVVGQYYGYRLEGEKTEEELKKFIKELKNEKAEAVGSTNLLTFLTAEDNPRILAAAGDEIMTKNTGLIAGIIVMILFTYVISVFVIHQIQQESSVIGALYALGASKKDLLFSYILLPAVISFLGGITGMLLGFSPIGADFYLGTVYQYYSLPVLERVYPPYLLIYSILMPAVVCIVVNFLVVNRRLSQPTLSLMRKEQKQGSGSRIQMGKIGFIRKFQIRQILREKRAALTVFFGMLVSLLVLVMGINCYVLCENVKNKSVDDTTYEYMYMLKYPTEQVPEGGEPVYMKKLTKTFAGYSLNVTIMGMDEENPYYDIKGVKGKSKATASTAVMEKYGLKTGEKLILTDETEEIDYVFTIESTTEYAAALTIFMDIDSMRELFGQSEDYYNVLLSVEELDLESAQIYGRTTKEDIRESSSVFASMMQPMITIMVTAACIIFCTVMFLMLNVLIDRATMGISLVKVFGYKTGEVRKLYLDGNIITIIAGAAICIPIAKAVMDRIYPYMIANVACGMDLTYSWEIYAIIFAGIITACVVIEVLLAGKTGRITPAEVLKNRE